jgi:hypothetical protein
MDTQIGSINHLAAWLCLQIVQVLGMDKPGPVVGKLAVLAREWQFMHTEFHPDALKAWEQPSLPPDALVEYLKQEHGKMVTL